MAGSRIHLEDEIWRAYGTMLHARCMDFNEFMELLSTLRLGVETGIMTKIDIKTINRLMIMGQPGHLRKYGDKTIGDLDIIRAEVISKLLRSTELEN